MHMLTSNEELPVISKQKQSSSSMVNRGQGRKWTNIYVEGEKQKIPQMSQCHSLMNP